MAGFCDACFVPDALSEYLGWVGRERPADVNGAAAVVGSILTLGAVGECPEGSPHEEDQGEYTNYSCQNTNERLMDIVGELPLGFWPCLKVVFHNDANGE
jgi:hypothetical protein